MSSVPILEYFMTYEHLCNLFYNWGWYVKPEAYKEFREYLLGMMKRKRVMVVMKDELIVAILCFYITNDYTKLYKKGTWDLAIEDENGSQMYIDKLVCRRWTKSIRELVQDSIEYQFPQVEEVYYHRAPKDRCVKLLTRRCYA